MSALELAGKALQAVEGDEALALVQTERSGMARFAGSEVHQPTLIENETVELQVVRDGRLGIATGNRTDDEGLRALAARAAEAADNAPPDPDFPGLAPAAEPARVEGYDEETAALGADDQARLAAAAIDASERDLYGFVTSGVTGIAIASSTGLAVEQTMTDVAALALAAVDGASGYAERTGWRLADVDPAAAAVEANEKAALTRGAVELEPGSYPAVLEAPAFAELLAYFSYDAFGALGLVEERSYAFDKLGEKVFDERFSLADDALDARGLPKAFDFEGVPRQRVELVQDGVLTGVVWDRDERPARGRRAGDDRARAAELAAPLGPAGDLALGRGRRGRVARAAGGAGRRRHLRHAAPLPEHRRPARGDRDRDDARRDLPHPRRQDRRPARQPALHRLGATAAGRAAGPDPRARADQPERLLRRALPDRAALAGDRDGALRRHRRRLWPGSLTAP